MSETTKLEFSASASDLRELNALSIDTGMPREMLLQLGLQCVLANKDCFARGMVSAADDVSKLIEGVVNRPARAAQAETMLEYVRCIVCSDRPIEEKLAGLRGTFSEDVPNASVRDLEWNRA